MTSFECFERSMHSNFCQPKYPSFLFMNTINKMKYKNKCLDVGIGAGQLLFSLVSHFKKLKGIDIDEKMLSITKQKLDKMEIQIQKKISIEKQNILKMNNLQKYDLIVVGQTLHELPINETVRVMKNLLLPHGKLLIINYYLNNVQFKTKQCFITHSFDSDEDSSYQRFSQKIRPYFDFDEQILHKAQTYKNLTIFQQIFTKVEKQIVQIPVEMCHSSYLQYLKSYSGLQNYILKNKDNPLAQIQNGCKEERICNFDFIRIECSTD